MRRTQFTQYVKRETKTEAMNKISFRDQDHLDKWNTIVSNLKLDEPIDCISLWRMYFTDSNETKHYIVSLKSYDET